MAKSSRKAATETDWKQVLSAVALAVAVFGTLLLGAVLQADPEHPALTPEATILDSDAGPADLAATPLEAEATTDDARQQAPALEPGLGIRFVGDGDLVDRAAADERRLQASGNGYTLQYAVLCDTDNVRAKLEALNSRPDFYLLTMLHQDRACFRLCWGFYDTEQQARAERDVPALLRSITRDPKVISIAEALP